MKVYVNRRPVIGPWGGGNKTVTALCDALKAGGHDVVFNLENKDIDLMFCFDPRPNGAGENYNSLHDYKNRHGVPIIQRVGDIGTHGKPWLTQLVKASSTMSDMLIFPSLWAKEKIGFSGENYSIIHNAPVEEFYKYRRNSKPDEKLGIVTHHWSTNPKKGFKFYSQLDEVIGNDAKLEFLYIGRLPPGLKFKNSRYIEASGDNEFLAKTISEQDIYLTASEEEAGANHVLEAMACGLPVVYHENGGSISNYCNEYGISYSSIEEMLQAVKDISNNYFSYKTKVMCYNSSISSVIDQYMETICNTR